MILSVRLVNWRSHEDSTLTFKRGTNLLIGEMGSGKSSILDAISFALFGTFPALERRRLKLEDVLRTEQPFAEIQLTFQWNGTPYRVVRRLERKRGIASDAQFFKNEELVDSGPVAVNRYIEQLLEVDYDLFTRAIYSEQNNIDYFLNLDPRRRKQEMDTLLGLDRFETVRANAVSVANRIRAQRKNTEERLDRERMREVEKRKIRVEEEERRIKQALAKAQEEERGMEKGRETAEKEFSRMHHQKQEYDRAREMYARTESRYEHIQKQVKGITRDKLEQERMAVAAVEKEWETQRKEKRELEEKVQKCSEQKAQAEAQWKALEKQQKEFIRVQEEWGRISGGKTPDALRQYLERQEQAYISLQAQFNAATNEKEALLHDREVLSPDLTRCPLCEQPLTRQGIVHVREEKEKLEKQLTEQLSGYASQLKGLEKERVEKRAIVQQAERLWTALEEGKHLETEQRHAKTKHESLKKEWETLQETAAQLEEKLEKKQKEREEKVWQLKEWEKQWMQQQELQQLKKEMEDAERWMKKVAMDDEIFEKARGQLERTRMAYERCVMEKKNQENQYRSTREMREMLERELTGMQQRAGEIAWLLKLEEELDVYKDAVVETQAELRATLGHAINAALNDIWRIFYPYKNYKELRLQATPKDYVFEIREREEWKPLETVASGGERSCAALTLRVALAMVLTPNLSWLILDEPTHNLDQQAVNLLSQTLQFRVPEVVTQTFVITHEEALMGSDFAASYKLLRDKANQGATRVEEV